MKYVISLKSDYAKCYFSNKMNELINKDTVVLLENDLPDNYL